MELLDDESVKYQARSRLSLGVAWSTVFGRNREDVECEQLELLTACSQIAFAFDEHDKAK